MIDFDTLVLAPLLSPAIFGRPATITPVVSQPNADPFVVYGDFRITNPDMILEDGILSTNVFTFSVRVSDFAVFVRAGDQIAIDGTAYLVDDSDPDAQGGSLITLKKAQQ